MTIRRTLLPVILMAALVSATIATELHLPHVFSAHMVLQRELPVPVWGWADAGKKVTVTFAGANVSATTGVDGRWQARLPAMPANAEGRELSISDGTKTVVIKDVLVGEVWLCGGQSNMETDMGWCGPEDARSADLPTIRFIKADHVLAPTPQDDVKMSSWTICKGEPTLRATAAGFYFARRIQRELKVPIGLLDTSWGGSGIEFWIPLESWKNVPELRRDWERETAEFQKNIGDYYTKVERWLAESRAVTAAGGVCGRVPEMPGHREYGHMYNGMTNAFAPYALRGMLWYQGEANASGDISYLHQMRGLIDGWRKRWNQPEAPFLFVQLPNFEQANDNPAGGDGWSKMREVQAMVLPAVPNSGMAVTIDVGESNDIHPRNKLDVGERLALWALAKTYGQSKLVYRSPFFKTLTIEGTKARISFEQIGGGLMVGRKDGRAPVAEDKGGKLKRFAIAGEDKKWHWADAVIDGSTVVVSSPQVPKPVAVRYAYAMNPSGCNLYNRDGLPAAPFRTDNW